MYNQLIFFKQVEVINKNYWGTRNLTKQVIGDELIFKSRPQEINPLVLIVSKKDKNFIEFNTIVTTVGYSNCLSTIESLCYNLIGQMDDYLLKNLVSIIDIELKEPNIGYLLWFKFKQQHKYCFERVDQNLEVKVPCYLMI